MGLEAWFSISWLWDLKCVGSKPFAFTHFKPAWIALISCRFTNIQHHLASSKTWDSCPLGPRCHGFHNVNVDSFDVFVLAELAGCPASCSPSVILNPLTSESSCWYSSQSRLICSKMKLLLNTLTKACWFCDPATNKLIWVCGANFKHWVILQKFLHFCFLPWRFFSESV